MLIENSLIIPCFNEGENLENMFDEILNLPAAIGGELILVDNGSSDQTRSIIQRLQNANENIVLKAVSKNIGYGHGILMGLSVARGKFVGWMHADGQMSFNDAIIGFLMISKKNNPDEILIMAKRKNRSIYDNFYTFGMSFFETFLFHKLMFDITATPKIMSKNFIDKWREPPFDFSLDLFCYLVAKKNRMKIFKFDISYETRKKGRSSWNSGFISRIKLIIRVIIYSINLRFKMFFHEEI